MIRPFSSLKKDSFSNDRLICKDVFHHCVDFWYILTIGMLHLVLGIFTFTPTWYHLIWFHCGLQQKIDKCRKWAYCCAVISNYGAVQNWMWPRGLMGGCKKKTSSRKINQVDWFITVEHQNRLKNGSCAITLLRNVDTIPNIVRDL